MIKGFHHVRQHHQSNRYQLWYDFSIPYWQNTIVPEIRKFVKKLDNNSQERKSSRPRSTSRGNPDAPLWSPRFSKDIRSPQATIGDEKRFFRRDKAMVLNYEGHIPV